MDIECSENYVISTFFYFYELARFGIISIIQDLFKNNRIGLCRLQNTSLLYSQTCLSGVSTIVSAVFPLYHAVLEFFLMSSMVSKRHPFSTAFKFGNKKIAGTKTWGVRELGRIGVGFLALHSRTGKAYLADALSWWRNHLLYHHNCGLFLWKCFGKPFQNPFCNTWQLQHQWNQRKW